MKVDSVEIEKWKNIHLSFLLKDGILPEGLTEPSLLVVVDDDETVLDIVLLNEGCDSEFKLTDIEKEQLLLMLQKELEIL